MTEKPHVFCLFMIGPMGSGKSTVGRHLATLLEYDFVDSDAEIETRAGADIPWIFDVEGEQGFRHREEKIINLLSRRKNIVLATGGGAVLEKKNRKRLKTRGLVVYLRASIKQQIDRTARDRHRPLLQNGNPEQTIKDLMVVREPLYIEVADVVVDTNRRNPKSVSNEIIKQIKIHQQSSGS